MMEPESWSDTWPAHDAGARPEYAAAEDLQPLALLADSQVLFWQPRGMPLLRRLLGGLGRDDPRAAFLGAAGGDDPDAETIFAEAMALAGIDRARAIPTRPDPADLAWLESAHVIVLGGGDVARGMEAFRAAGIDAIVADRRAAGALLVGVSAGAVQLGIGAWHASGAGGGAGKSGLLATLGLCPHVIGAHQEDRGWADLRRALAALGDQVRAFGIPRGGGLLIHPDATLEPLRLPVFAFRHGAERKLVETLLMPERGGA